MPIDQSFYSICCLLVTYLSGFPPRKFLPDWALPKKNLSTKNLIPRLEGAPAFETEQDEASSLRAESARPHMCSRGTHVVVVESRWTISGKTEYHVIDAKHKTHCAQTKVSSILKAGWGQPIGAKTKNFAFDETEHILDNKDITPASVSQ